jgi:hypothetical protein
VLALFVYLRFLVLNLCAVNTGSAVVHRTHNQSSVMLRYSDLAGQQAFCSSVDHAGGSRGNGSVLVEDGILR